MIKTTRRDTEEGQVLVIVALALVTLVAMVALVIDGGFAWGKQRDTQNAADAAAKAGASILADNIAGVSPARTDLDVENAVNASIDANVVDLPAAYYTNITGQMLTPAGAVTTDETAAALVGDGAIPTGAAGVRAVTEQVFDTFLAGVIGFRELKTDADATAVAGYITGTCEADAGCIVLPVTIPVNMLGCDGSNDPSFVTDAEGDKILWDAPSDALTIPLCQNGPGNVGWLDWTPNEGTPGCPGTGTAELVCVINDPTNPYLSWPGWYKITSTGNVNSGGVENGINAYGGQAVMIPQFDLTCDETPTGPGVEGCPEGAVGGHGAQQWYHLAGMSSFRLCTDDLGDDGLPLMPSCVSAGLTQGAYVSGGPDAVCDTGNGGTSCLAGQFEEIMYEGEVTANPGPNTGTAAVGIQLIE